MKMLTGQQWDKALDYIHHNARDLEKSLAAFHLQGGSRDAVLRELETYLNSGGGFGRALEPDARYAGSSVLATTTALRLLRELVIPPDHPMILNSIRYLLRHYRPETRSWFYLPPEAQSAPRAPWWNWPQGPPEEWRDFVLNPRPEIVGWLYVLGPSEVDTVWRDELLAETLQCLETMSEALTRDALVSYLELFSNPHLVIPDREEAGNHMLRALNRLVERDESMWGDYCLKPIDIAEGPESPFTSMFREEIESNLDYEIDVQELDGSWGPYWSWEDDYPEHWQMARREWSGILTLHNLRVLKNFNRVEKEEERRA